MHINNINNDNRNNNKDQMRTGHLCFQDFKMKCSSRDASVNSYNYFHRSEHECRSNYMPS